VVGEKSALAEWLPAQRLGVLVERGRGAVRVGLPQPAGGRLDRTWAAGSGFAVRVDRRLCRATYFAASHRRRVRVIWMDPGGVHRPSRSWDVRARAVTPIRAPGSVLLARAASRALTGRGWSQPFGVHVRLPLTGPEGPAEGTEPTTPALATARIARGAGCPSGPCSPRYRPERPTSKSLCGGHRGARARLPARRATRAPGACPRPCCRPGARASPVAVLVDDDVPRASGIARTSPATGG
jgi:hypothetical protein